MELTGVISSIRLARSLISGRESTTEKRRTIYDSVVGQEITFTPEIGEQIGLTLRNCAFDDDSGVTYLTVGVSDPNRPNDLFRFEADLRYHYRQLFLKTERHNPLVRAMNFIELGPEDFKIELTVNSADPPTLQLVFERVEKTLAQTHTEYHQFLRAQYEEYHDEFEVKREYQDGRTQYVSEADLDKSELIPQPNEDDFHLWTTGRELEMQDRISISHYAYDYVKSIVTAEEFGDDYFVLT